MTYKIVELREKMLQKVINPAKIEKVLNDHAQEGWTLKQIVMNERKAIDQMFIILER